MKDIIEKYKKDNRYRTKVKLILYTLFIIIVSIYALTINNNSFDRTSLENAISSINKTNTNSDEDLTSSKKTIINIPTEYDYNIKVIIDNEEITYTGTKTPQKETIIKKINDIEETYIFEENKYYQENSGTYIITTKEKIYDIVDYTYINLDNINIYLTTATKENNQYLVYLKDIIKGDTSDTYFVITLNDNKINIDYTPLMKKFNLKLTKYYVNIEIIEKE